MFRCSCGYPLEPRGHAPPALLFLSQRCQTAGRICSSFDQNNRRISLCRTPFGAKPAISSQCIGYSREVGGAGRHRVPQWLRLYERPPVSVKHFVAEFLSFYFAPYFQSVVQKPRAVDIGSPRSRRCKILDWLDKNAAPHDGRPARSSAGRPGTVRQRTKLLDSPPSRSTGRGHG